jgi:hypothetical protein
MGAISIHVVVDDSGLGVSDLIFLLNTVYPNC